jgi:hypothetical protein
MTVARMAKVGGMPYARLVEENASTPFIRPKLKNPIWRIGVGTGLLRN